jgi:hypothetical protein
VKGNKKKELIMKSTFLRGLGMGVALILLSSVAGLAQSQVRANIPFDFVVGNLTMPAGEYEIGPAQNWDSFHIWVKKLDGSATTNAISYGWNNPAKPEKAYLIFNKYADKCFLSRICTKNEGFGRKLYVSKAEKELANAAKSQSAMTSFSPKTIAIAAK